MMMAPIMEYLRGLGTLSAFIAFIGICVWAYSGRRKEDFNNAAQLPFADDEHEETSP